MTHILRSRLLLKQHPKWHIRLHMQSLHRFSNSKHQRLRSTRAVPRRRFLAGGAGLIFAGAGAWLIRGIAKTPARVFLPAGTLPIRPPGALADDDDFKSACVHCGLCGSVCDTGAIRFFGLDDSEHGPVTP